jgi:hypothetical protein
MRAEARTPGKYELLMLKNVVALTVICFLIAGQAHAADETHPIKKLAAAEADAEIALKEVREVAGKFDRSYETRRNNIGRQPDAARRVVQEARRKEEAKPDEARSALVFEACDDANRAIEDLWSDQQQGLREMDAAVQKLRERLEGLRESFNAARQLAENWKRAEVPLDALAPVFAAISAEAKVIGEQFPKLDGDVDKRYEDWSKQIATTKEKLGIK